MESANERDNPTEGGGTERNGVEWRAKQYDRQVRLKERMRKNRAAIPDSIYAPELAKVGIRCIPGRGTMSK
jgi:hypothetical protein